MKRKKNWKKKEEAKSESATNKKKRGEEEERSLKICFWNTARVINKCEDTWKYLEEIDIIGLTKTWLEEYT